MDELGGWRTWWTVELGGLRNWWMYDLVDVEFVGNEWADSGKMVQDGWE